MVKEAAAVAKDGLLAELEKDFPAAWIPTEAGDTVVGVMTRVGEGVTQFGPAPVVEVKQADGAEVTVWLFSQMIRSEFARLKPVPGERIAVRYLGDQTVKNKKPGRGETYKKFRLAVDRPVGSETVDWAVVLDPARSGPPPTTDDGGDEVPF
jgi:hypothetical protein